MKRVVTAGLALLSVGLIVWTINWMRDLARQHEAEEVVQHLAAEQLRKENVAKEALRKMEAEKAAKAAAEAAIIAARAAKVREDNAKRLRRHCMSKNEIDAFLWVKGNLFKWIIKKGEDKKAAKARAEIATAKAFGLEPANWAKRDIVEYVENERIFQRERDEVSAGVQKENSVRVQKETL